MANQPQGTGKLSRAIRDTQQAAQRGRSLQNDSTLLSEHPLGSSRRFNGNNTVPPRRQTTSPNVVRYG